MYKTIADFFIDSNTVDFVDEKEYAVIDSIVASVESMVRTTGCGVYLLDYYKKNVIYVSENIRIWSGMDAVELLKTGLSAYLKHFPEEDLAMLYEINDAAFKFWAKLPANECLDYVVSYDFRYNQFTFNQRYNPMMLNNGKIWLAVCAVSVSSSNESGHIVMKNTTNGKTYKYSREKKCWIPLTQIVLSEKEKAIIRYAAQNRSSTEISKIFHMSVETVRSQKKKLFKKLQVNSMTEAIIFVSSNDLL